MMHDTGITSETADVAALAIDGPQPVWMTLNAARERAFTGEIVFETDPEVFAYLDNGVVYYAERASDPSLGRRLLGAGVLDVAQLECGTVRVGDIEHLGRLFERDPSVDRDAVIVLAETMTHDLITELANRSIAPVRFTAYRHHPSGVHRWFVAQSDPAAVARPVSAVSQLDATVLDELPSLSFDEADVADLVIEWDDDIDDLTERYSDVFELTSALVEFDDAEIETDARERARAEAEALAFAHADADALAIAQAEADALALADADADVDALAFVDDDADVEALAFVDVDVDDDDDADALALAEDDADEPAATHGDVERLVVVERVDMVQVSDVDEAAPRPFDFSVVWPDGSEEPATQAAAYLAASTPSPEEPSDNGSLRFTMPPLELSDEPESADADVSDDVAEAVRRAIAAIESAGVAAPEIESALEASTAIGENGNGGAPADVADPRPSVQAPAGFGGFAPPTMATHAEVLYAQMEAVDSMFDAAPDLNGSPTNGRVASVGFVDSLSAVGSYGGNERSSALRRLIGSLRRKDI